MDLYKIIAKSVDLYPYVATVDLESKICFINKEADDPDYVYVILWEGGITGHFLLPRKFIELAAIGVKVTDKNGNEIQAHLYKDEWEALNKFYNR